MVLGWIRHHRPQELQSVSRIPSGAFWHLWVVSSPKKSTQNTTCELYNEMNRLVQLFANSNLKLLCFETSSQLSNENLRDSTWITIAQVEVEQDIEPFFVAVRKFYLATIQKMLKKFLFDDTHLQPPHRLCREPRTASF